MDFDKHVLIGLDNDGDLVTLELSFHDLNRGTKWENDHYYFSVHGFSSIKENDEGEREARERLEDYDYWDDLGYLNQTEHHNPVLNHIDFKGLADEVLSGDGWQMTNGEYYYFAHYEEGEYYLNLQWIGRDREKVFDKKEYKTLYIGDEDLKFLSNLGEIKPDSKELAEVKKILSKYQDKHKIIKDMLD